MANGEVNDAEVHIRVGIVLELILRGFTRRKIVDAITTDYKVCVKTADNYIAKAKEIIIEETKSSREDMLALSIARYNDLYQKNLQIQDYRECRQINESMAKLFGLEIKSVDVTSGGEKLDNRIIIEHVDMSKPQNNG